MGRNSWIVIVVAVMVSVASVATASNPLLMGPSPGLAVNGTTLSSPTTTASDATTPLGTTASAGSTLSGPSAGLTTGTATSGTTTRTGTGGTTGTVTSGGATTSATPGVTPGTTGTTTSTALAVEQIVSLARTVQPDAPVTAATVPAGRQLVITDVIITNPGTTAACGAAVSAAGGATSPPLTGGRAIASAESGTGLLCVPAQTSLSVALTTGLEFESGQSVQLANATPTANGTPAPTAGPLHYHLRGFLVSTTTAGGGA